MKTNLIPRAYRIRKDQDTAIKKKAKKENKGEGQIVREGIDMVVGEYLTLPNLTKMKSTSGI